MTTLSIADLRPRVDIEQASRHLRLLHDGGVGWVSVVLLGRSRRELHAFTAVDQLLRPGDPDECAEALQEVVDERWNVYAGLAVLDKIPEKGRGSRTDVASIPGVWCDLDVKPGGADTFQSSAEVCAYLDRFDPPTLVIDSGSGGLHAYWLVYPEQRPDAGRGEWLLRRWRDHMLSLADGHAVDYVQDTTRVLRLAGSVRWPKDGEDRTPARVEIVREGPRYHLQELELICKEAADAAEELRRERVAQRREWESKHASLIAGANMDEYRKIITVFNHQQDWGVMLERDGWTLCADERGRVANCRYWTRPGKSAADGKSAATDWTDPAGMPRLVMTIYSRDPALQDVAEVETDNGQLLCTKWHFALVRLFNGDEGELLRSIGRGKGVLG